MTAADLNRHIRAFLHTDPECTGIERNGGYGKSDACTCEPLEENDCGFSG